MDQATMYLPGFDASHLATYFLNDHKIIAEIFLVSNETMPDDLDMLRNAFEAKDLYLIREAIHKIKPSYKFVGLLKLDKEVGQFYDLCLGATSVEELLVKYGELWPKLIQARELIGEQVKLFYRKIGGV
jgi:hypothetical protein